MCVCVCVRRAPKRTGKLHFEPQARPTDQIHTKICPNGRLREYSLKHRLCLKWARTVGRKSDVCQYIILKTDWRFNVNQRTKCKEKIPHSS